MLSSSSGGRAAILEEGGDDEEALIEAARQGRSRLALLGGVSVVAAVGITVAFILAGAASRTPTVTDSDRWENRKLFEDRVEVAAFTTSPVGGDIRIFKADPGFSEPGYMLKGVPGMWTRNVAYRELYLPGHDRDVAHRQAFQALAAKDPEQIVLLLDGDIYSGGCPESVLRRRYEVTTRAAGARVVLGADAVQRASMLDVSTRLTNASRVAVRNAVMKAFGLDEDAMTKYVLLDTTLGTNGPADYIYPNAELMMGPVADVLDFLNCVLGVGGTATDGYSRELGMTVCYLMSKSKVTLDYTGSMLLSSAHVNIDELMVIKHSGLDHAVLQGPLCFIESGAHHQNPWAGGLMDVSRKFEAWPADHPSLGPIPLVVYVTSPAAELSGELADMWRQNMAHFPPGTRLAYYNDAMMAQSVREISAELASSGVTDGAFEAYSTLRPMAFRADLWRCMILWRYGGIYLDHEVKLLEDMWNYIDFGAAGTLWLVQDRPPGSFWNAFLVGPPRHPAFEMVIKRIVENVRYRNYDRDPLRLGSQANDMYAPLAITGPIAWGWALGIYGIRGGVDTWTFEGFRNLPKGRSPRIFASCAFEGMSVVYNFGGDRHSLCVNVGSLHQLTGTTYWRMYNNYQAYCDSGGPPCPPA